MKNAIVITILVMFVSCSTSKTATTDATQRDGSSYETAIIVKSVSAEYEWIRENYPNSQLVLQALLFHKKKPYDLLQIVTSDGVKKDVYFDISQFYGKF